MATPNKFTRLNSVCVCLFPASGTFTLWNYRIVISFIFNVYYFLLYIPPKITLNIICVSIFCRSFFYCIANDNSALPSTRFLFFLQRKKKNSSELYVCVFSICENWAWNNKKREYDIMINERWMFNKNISMCLTSMRISIISTFFLYFSGSHERSREKKMNVRRFSI